MFSVIGMLICLHAYYRYYGIHVLVLFAVAQVFLSKSLIATLVQNALTFVVTAWFEYSRFKGDNQRVAETTNNGVRISRGRHLHACSGRRRAQYLARWTLDGND